MIPRKCGLISSTVPEILAMLHHVFSSSNIFSSFVQNLGCWFGRGFWFVFGFFFSLIFALMSCISVRPFFTLLS